MHTYGARPGAKKTGLWAPPCGGAHRPMRSGSRRPGLSLFLPRPLLPLFPRRPQRLVAQFRVLETLWAAVEPAAALFVLPVTQTQRALGRLGARLQHLDLAQAGARGPGYRPAGADPVRAGGMPRQHTWRLRLDRVHGWTHHWLGAKSVHRKTGAAGAPRPRRCSAASAQLGPAASLERGASRISEDQPPRARGALALEAAGVPVACARLRRAIWPDWDAAEPRRLKLRMLIAVLPVGERFVDFRCEVSGSFHAKAANVTNPGGSARMSGICSQTVTGTTG